MNYLNEMKKVLIKTAAKSYWINYFCVRHQTRPKHNQHFKMLFFGLNSHLGPSSEMPTRRKLNLLHINSIYFVFSSL